MTSQLLNFLIHLRLHYQFLILSGAYLLAALFVEKINHQQFWLQFLNIHMLLFGGATAYNSWWDKDEGPIGGLKHPPKMKRWMWPASLALQFIGLGWALFVGWQYALIYVFSILFFWLYSTPLARWKGKPFLSLVAIGISTGTNSFLLGILAAGVLPISTFQLLIALGVACIILSLYPASQIYQTEEDLNRGDHTFALQYGIIGVKKIYTLLFAIGAAIISFGLLQVQPTLGFFFGSIGLILYFLIGVFIWRLQNRKEEYKIVMRIKAAVSFAFVLFILSALLTKVIM